MLQCAARQFENELVERLSILADRHLRPPAPEGGTVSMPTILIVSSLDTTAGTSRSSAKVPVVILCIKK